jgi:hypothetical protein
VHWFFALTEASTAFRQYADMIMVAVHTAKTHTSLVPHCIYDGGENEFTEWLTRHDVAIIRHRSFVHEQLVELGERKGIRISPRRWRERFLASNCLTSSRRSAARHAFFTPIATSCFSPTWCHS